MPPQNLHQLLNETTSVQFAFAWDDPTGTSIVSDYIIHYKVGLEPAVAMC